MPKNIECQFCGKEFPKSEITYVQGKPYCEDCVNEGEIYSDADVMDDDDDDEDDDEDDDDDDNDD